MTDKILATIITTGALLTVIAFMWVAHRTKPIDLRNWGRPLELPGEDGYGDAPLCASKNAECESQANINDQPRAA